MGNNISLIISISHMAKTLHTSHKELVVHMREFDIEVALDGMETEI